MKLIPRVLLFILIIFLVEKPFGYLVSQGILERQYDQRLEKLFAGEWKKGAIPELWDGNTAKRIVSILKKLQVAH